MPDAKRAAVVRSETAVSMAIYAIIPTTILWLIGMPGPKTLLGGQGIVTAMMGPAGVGTFMMTLALTMAIRARVRRGLLPAFAWPRGRRGLARVIPHALLGRAIVLGIIAVVVLVPAGLAAVALLHVLPLSRTGFVIFNVIYGAFVGAVMTPYVVTAALADEGPLMKTPRQELPNETSRQK